MGDTGSLTLGGIIAALAIIVHKELLIPIFCGVFLVENAKCDVAGKLFQIHKKKIWSREKDFFDESLASSLPEERIS